MSDIDPLAEARALLDALPCAVRKPWGSEIEPICGADVRVYVGARCVAYVCRYTDDMEGAAADLIVAAPRLLAALCDEVDRLRAVRDAAREWRDGKEWADQNPSKMLSSCMTSEEAAEVMRCYFDKERALVAAVEDLR